MHHHGWLVFFVGVVTLGVALALTHGGNRSPQGIPFDIQPPRLVPTSPTLPARI